MKIGIVQPIVGSIGGNDMVLKGIVDSLKGHTLKLYTFSKVKFDGFDQIISKAPFHLPFFGIYQNMLNPKFDIDCDVVISTTGMPVNTDKRLIIYDQNNLWMDFQKGTPAKYEKGFWKLYYLPYKKFHKNRIISNARYISNSEYSARMLSSVINRKVEVVYPGVPLHEFYMTEKQPQICMITRISPEKNLEFAVNVLNRTPYKCVIFGNVTQPNIPYLNRLRKLARGNVTIKSGDRNELKHLLAESKVYFASSKETFGISTVEAIASGCVPVVPDHTAHPEVVPINELRYSDIQSAVKCIEYAMGYDPTPLQNHIHKFDISRFADSVRSWVE